MLGGMSSDQGVVDLLKYIPRRVVRLELRPEHAAGGGHHQRCGYALAGRVTHHEPGSTLREEVEVVEVSPNLSGWLVEGEICQPFSSGTSLGSEACWMLRATLSSCSMRSRSRPLLL